MKATESELAELRDDALFLRRLFVDQAVHIKDADSRDCTVLVGYGPDWFQTNVLQRILRIARALE